MSVRHRVILAYSLLLASVTALAAQPVPRLTILTEHSPPANMLVDGTVGGSGSDKVREVMARTGVAYTMQLQPWKRAYTAALEQPDTCVFSTTRVPEREPLFKWIGPTGSGTWVLLGRADRHYAFKTLDDVRSLRIGTYIGDARDAYLRARGLTVDPAQNDTINGQKLLLGRIDLWAVSMRAGSNYRQLSGWAEPIVPVLVFNKIDVYLACNRSVPDALVARMNAALVAMRRDGTLRRIERKYANWRGRD